MFRLGRRPPGPRPAAPIEQQLVSKWSRVDRNKRVDVALIRIENTLLTNLRSHFLQMSRSFQMQNPSTRRLRRDEDPTPSSSRRADRNPPGFLPSA